MWRFVSISLNINSFYRSLQTLETFKFKHNSPLNILEQSKFKLQYLHFTLLTKLHLKFWIETSVYFKRMQSNTTKIMNQKSINSSYTRLAILFQREKLKNNVFPSDSKHPRSITTKLHINTWERNFMYQSVGKARISKNKLPFAFQPV